MAGLGFIFAITLFTHLGLMWQFDLTSHASTSLASLLSAMICLAISIAIAGACAWGIDYFLQMGPAIMGSTIFGLIGFIILFSCSMIYRLFGGTGNILSPFWSAALMFVVAEVGFAYGWRHTQLFYFITVAFFSSYLIVRGISILLGGYESEAEIVIGILSDIKNVAGVKFTMILYIGAIVYLTVILTKR
jgi:hypothetical protein